MKQREIKSKPQKSTNRDSPTNCYQVKGTDGKFRGGHHPSCPYHESQAFTPRDAAKAAQ